MILAGGVGIVDCETVDDEVGFELDGKDKGVGAGACATADGTAARTGASALRDVTWCRAISSAVCLRPVRYGSSPYSFCVTFGAAPLKSTLFHANRIVNPALIATSTICSGSWIATNVYSIHPLPDLSLIICPGWNWRIRCRSSSAFSRSLISLTAWRYQLTSTLG
jgi:hypothetical protein